VNGYPSRVMTILRMLGGIAARCGRRAERTPTYSDRADRLKQNIVLSKRDSYQRRGHLTVCKVASYMLTLPRILDTNFLGWRLPYLGTWKPSESVRIRLSTESVRIRPNPEPISVGSKYPYCLCNTAKESPAGLLGFRPNPSESDHLPNPSESRAAIPELSMYG